MRLAVLAVLVLITQGCTSSPELARMGDGAAWGDEPDASVLAAGLDWPRPVRVGVLPFEELELEGFHLQVTSAIGDGVDRAVITRGPRTGGRIDYMLESRYRLDGDPDGVRNFLTCFPGFVIFAPSWAPLRAEYQLDTQVRIVRVRDHEQVASFGRTDRFEMRHTSAGHAVASYLGWGAPVAPPLILAPFITGIVAAVSPFDERAVARLLSRDPVGRAIARDIAAQVVYHLDQDLRGSRGDGFDGLRDDGLDDESDDADPLERLRRGAPRPAPPGLLLEREDGADLEGRDDREGRRAPRPAR